MKLKRKLDHFLERSLMFIETLIALISICVLVGLLIMYVYQIFADPQYLRQDNVVHLFLQDLLAIVIGLEFVKLLMHMTPANILEVLILAIARYIVVGHGGALDNLLSILCIVALFAAKRFLIPRKEFHMGLENDSPEETPLSHQPPTTQD